MAHIYKRTAFFCSGCVLFCNFETGSYYVVLAILCAGAYRGQSLLKFPGAGLQAAGSHTQIFARTVSSLSHGASSPAAEDSFQIQFTVELEM